MFNIKYTVQAKHELNDNNTTHILEIRTKNHET